MDNSPFLFSELPQRMTGGYSYNTEPLYVVVRPAPCCIQIPLYTCICASDGPMRI